MIQRERIYKVCEKKYGELSKTIDEFINVDKNIEGGWVVYSAAELKPGDFPVSPIVKGQIRLNHNNNLIIFSGNLELAQGLENKLKELLE